MKTNLIRLMAIATLATTMSFASEGDKSAETTKAECAPGSMQPAGKKVRKEKQSKPATTQSSNEIQGIWG